MSEIGITSRQIVHMSTSIQKALDLMLNENDN
jgi:hypothetical protein